MFYLSISFFVTNVFFISFGFTEKVRKKKHFLNSNFTNSHNFCFLFALIFQIFLQNSKFFTKCYFYHINLSAKKHHFLQKIWSDKNQYDQKVSIQNYSHFYANYEDKIVLAEDRLCFQMGNVNPKKKCFLPIEKPRFFY